jgi:outer membrane protein assembly factor BamB
MRVIFPKLFGGWCGIASALAAVAATPAFTDPAPPKVETRHAGNPAAASENSEATFHHAPKPLPGGAVTNDWPSFLGPTHNMFSAETKLLKEFPPDGLAPVWEMTKGDGFAAPAILGERLVLFHRVGENEVVDCVQPADGKRYWRQIRPTAYKDRYGFNPGPRASPVIADGRVFTFGVAGRLQCLDLETGQVLWSRELLREFNVKQNFFGVGSTPLVEGDKLIVNLGAPGGPCVAAFDLRSGKMVWGAGHEWGPSYASPIPATVHGKRRVFVFAGGESKPATGGLMSIDPANGSVDFRFPWRGEPYESVNAASPVVIGNQVFVAECYGSGGAMVAVSADGKAKPAWTNPSFGMHFMTAIPKGDYLYGVDGHGPQDAEFACVELKTGKEVWRTQPIWEETVQSRRGKSAMKVGTFRANLLMVDGRTLCLGEFGHLLWLDLEPTGYRELARTWLFAATESWTPPVVSRGLLYICQNSTGSLHNEPQRLICYDLRAPAE